ncbi:neuromedin-U receptor 2-like [Branchiostoma floridae]|uniref:Neuromedin-U receptor 2-like n=1 Tax=Branchiostoma floridae TaxID=7739 RepID=A0A9J7NDL5_BRAFL|nr:neuromedin-U receptor 2-like [Branchiostoma floridae]
MVQAANLTNTSWSSGNTTSPSQGITSVLYLYPHISVPTLVVGAVIFIVGVAGNSVVVASVLRFRQRGIYFYLLSLSLADLLVLLFGLPMKIAEWFFLSEWVLGTAMCKILAYLQLLSFTASVMTLTATAIERKFVILNPVKARTQQVRRRACRALLLVWGISLILSSPILFPVLLGKMLEEDPKQTRLHGSRLGQCPVGSRPGKPSQGRRRDFLVRLSSSTCLIGK